MKSDKHPFEIWLNKLEIKHLVIGFVIWTVIYRIIDSQTLDWFGKSNDSDTLVYFLQLIVASAFFGSLVVLILIPILKLLGLIKDY
jgi:hypothetical protein